MIRCICLIQRMVKQHDDLNCACICIQDLQKTWLICPEHGLSPPPDRSEVTPTPPPDKHRAELKTRSSSLVQMLSHISGQTNVTSLRDKGSQDGSRETRDKDTISALERGECVISAVVRLFPAHTLGTFHTDLHMHSQMNRRRHQREPRLELSTR